MEDYAEILAGFTPVTMIEAMEQLPPVHTFLRDLLVRGTPKYHDTEAITSDIVKGGMTRAAYVSRTGEPTTVGKKGFGGLLHVTPYIYEEIPFTAMDVKSRLPGETVYQKGAGNRLATRMGEWLGELNGRFIRREESQIADVIQTGKLAISGTGVNYEVDFQMDANQIIVNSGTDNWGSGTEDKIKQLTTAERVKLIKGAPPSTILLMGTTAAEAFIKDTEVLSYLNNRRVELGEIKPEYYADMQATYLGDFRHINLNVKLFTYSGGYENDSGTFVPYIDPDAAILITPAMDSRFDYGMIDNLKVPSFIGERFPMTGIGEKGKHGYVSLESSPLYNCRQPDAIIAMTTKS